MKTKRIVALALTAAMAVSMASMTAFAASTWKNYEVNTDDDEAIAGTQANLDQMIKVKDNDSEAEYYEGYVVRYQVEKPFAENDAAAWNGVKNYTYRKGSTISKKTTNGKTTTLYLLNKDDTTQTGAEEAGVLWKNFKSVAQDIGAPTLEEEHDVVFLGWTLDDTKSAVLNGYKVTDAIGNVQPSNTKADADFILQDANDIIADSGDLGKTTDAPIKLYPVFREKTETEKLQSQVNIANRPKVAKPAGEKEWVYTQKQLDRNTAKVSAPLAEDVSGDALKKCNAEMKHSRVYEIKPQVDGKVVDLKKGAVQGVKIPVSTVYDTTDEGTVKDYIQKGKLKVYHIGSDGKSRQVTGLGVTKENGKVYVTFKCGSFSEFVITKDPNARAQAGEEDGASGGNPATGEASTLPVAMLALAALSATGVVAYKKRKAE